MSTAIVIPTYKECENLKLLLPQILQVVEKPILIVADYFSGDGTRELISEVENAYYLPFYERGFASSLLYGLRYASQLGVEYAVQMDGDGSHRPEDIPQILEALQKGYDVVLGSRRDKGEAFKSRFLRARSNMACSIAKTILGLPYSDVTTGFHGFSKTALKTINGCSWKSKGFEIEVELVYKTHLKGLKIVEVPITFLKRINGKSKKPLLEPIQFIKTILRLI